MLGENKGKYLAKPDFRKNHFGLFLDKKGSKLTNIGIFETFLEFRQKYNCSFFLIFCIKLVNSSCSKIVQRYFSKNENFGCFLGQKDQTFGQNQILLTFFVH